MTTAMVADDTRWVLVAGAFENLSKEHIRAAEALGRMLADAGYGLIVGCWSGMDYLVTRAFQDAAGGGWQKRLIQIDTTGGGEPRLINVAPRLLDPRAPDGSTDYSEEAVCLAHAGVVVPGCIYSKPAMQALMRKKKPVLPVAYLGDDAFDVFIEMLEHWDNLPIRKVLTRRQFLELAMPSQNIASVERLLFASLQDKPVLFVSYRHADVPDAAARITELLVHRYGLRSVFIDVEGLQPGQTFPREIESAIRSARAVLPVIGPRWEGAGADGIPRILQRGDWVTKELLIAHNGGRSILPILVQRATLDVSSLPKTLRRLTPIHQTNASYESLEHDLRRVFETLDELILPRGGAQM